MKRGRPKKAIQKQLDELAIDNAKAIENLKFHERVANYSADQAPILRRLDQEERKAIPKPTSKPIKRVK